MADATAPGCENHTTDQSVAIGQSCLASPSHVPCLHSPPDRILPTSVQASKERKPVPARTGGESARQRRDICHLRNRMRPPHPGLRSRDCRLARSAARAASETLQSHLQRTPVYKPSAVGIVFPDGCDGVGHPERALARDDDVAIGRYGEIERAQVRIVRDKPDRSCSICRRRGEDRIVAFSIGTDARGEEQSTVSIEPEAARKRHYSGR